MGCLGLTFGLLMETTLLIIRTNRPQPLHEKYPELFDKKIWVKGGTGPTVGKTVAAVMGNTKPVPIGDLALKTHQLSPPHQGG